jgi:hypothetical protein
MLNALSDLGNIVIFGNELPVTWNYKEHLIFSAT